ncbi:hypothetical protein J5Y04_30925 [Kitasatospora sp. RG8]|uniref:hypothetical protein n=1 Tax=Kitasatospora sp. RG8 TaxID=2820815 RepID=UPI001ADFF23C|nr:hypothetical protein [Kitasatospora sp. RG8]MBP0453922.1 hypothetical protein [Kitasatospora sp. RG8]
MKYGSVRNSGTSDVLFEVASGEVCLRAGCGKSVPVPEPGKRGRRQKWCSTACKSKAARDKLKADALRSAEGVRAEVLRCAEAAVDAARAFLDAVDADPVAAYEEFHRLHGTLSARAAEAAEDVRDEVRWPDLTEQQRLLRRAEEMLMRPDVLARVDPKVLAEAPAAPTVSDRSENPAPATPPTGPAVSDRSEKTPVPAQAAAPAISDRPEFGAPVRVPAPAAPVQQRAQDFETLRRAACTNPSLRFGEPDRLDDLSPTLGEDWLVASWDDPQAEDVHQLLHRGRPIGWTAPLPDGPWGEAGHIAAEHQGEQTAVVRPRTHRSVGQALDVLHRAHLDRLRAERAMPDVQYLALKRPTGWSVPSARGLGDPDRAAFGDGLVHLTWPDHPGVQELQQGGRPVGWIEEYDVQRGIWTALIDSSLVADAASGEPLRCPGAEGALALLRRALGEDLTRW